MRSKAFTLTELLISIIIVSILGAAAAGALWLFFNSFSQIDDYTSAEFQMNHAIQRISRDFAMIGLGMPNNSDGSGSFAWAFRGEAPEPVTALFGPPPGEMPAAWAWGGPVTVAAQGLTNNGGPIRVNLVNPQPHGPDRNLFIGPQLFYAWGVPTGVMATITGVDMAAAPARVTSGANLWLETRTIANGEDILCDVKWDGRNVGLLPVEAGGASNNVRSWVLLPTLNIPLLVRSFVAGAPTANSVLNVTAAPPTANAPQLTARDLTTLDEIHLMQAARIFRDPDSLELRRVIMTEHNPAATVFPHEVLARNVVGLQFTFDPGAGVLTMFIAARGNERNPIGVQNGQQPRAWPSWLPDIAAEDTQFRIVVKTLTWRIRN